ncbi:hypothetical protein [Zhihengliuella halotolerans]|uniref:hypothetical protein n=1 Tax=Zhihengliuella halotolerans TaxID=370736 RepID=UPI000C80D2FE|nr:hypothetical protein [Zhihengliuella halotolerans]
MGTPEFRAAQDLIDACRSHLPDDVQEYVDLHNSCGEWTDALDVVLEEAPLDEIVVDEDLALRLSTHFGRDALKDVPADFLSEDFHDKLDALVARHQ